MNEAQKGEIIIYQSEEGKTKIEVRLEDDNVWLTQKMMAELFQTTPQNITLHLKNIFEEGELQEDATCKDFLQVQTEGARNDSAQSMNGEIPPCGRNDNAKNGQIPPFSRNDDAQSMNSEIPSCGRNDSAKNGQIPPFSRNDSSPCGEMREGSGGFAVTSFSPIFYNGAVIPNGTQCSEESPFSCQPPVIPSKARNLSTCDGAVIPNGTQCSEEAITKKTKNE
jgi:hypothetical protein